jgi:hypothetical protein
MPRDGQEEFMREFNGKYINLGVVNGPINESKHTKLCI